MPRARILQAIAGLDFSYTPGETVDLPVEHAAFADGVRAELVRSEPVEVAGGPTGRPPRKRAPRGEQA